MHKNNYLSRTEQEIWGYISSKDIIDNELLKLIFPDLSQNNRNKILHSLFKKGYLKRASRDVYYNLNNLDDYYKLALKIYPGYIGLTSALKYYNLIEYEDFTIFIITEKKYKTISLENYTLKYLPLKELCTGFTGIRISTVEKTLFDCFLKIKYLNYSILTKAIYEAKDINWDEFLKYFEKAPKSLSQKAGYILNLMKKETNYKVSNHIIKQLKSKVKCPVKLENNSKPSIYSREWKVQDNIGKKIILAWWYQ